VVGTLNCAAVRLSTVGGCEWTMSGPIRKRGTELESLSTFNDPRLVQGGLDPPIAPAILRIDGFGRGSAVVTERLARGTT
jgi:hypothetical protein